MTRGTRAAGWVVLAAVLVAAPMVVEWSEAPRDFGPDLAGALAAASADDRLVVVHLRHEQRDASSKLEQRTLADARVAERLASRFHQARLDALADPDAAARLAGAGAAVATLVLDGGGELVARLDGYLDPEPFLDWLERVAAAAPRFAQLAKALARDQDALDARLERADLLRRLGSIARAESDHAAAVALLRRFAPRVALPARERAHRLAVALLLDRGQVLAAHELRRLDPASYPPPPDPAATDVERPRAPR